MSKARLISWLSQGYTSVAAASARIFCGAVNRSTRFSVPCWRTTIARKGRVRFRQIRDDPQQGYPKAYHCPFHWRTSTRSPLTISTPACLAQSAACVDFPGTRGGGEQDSLSVPVDIGGVENCRPSLQ